jgi:hypothetical protein
MNFDQFVRVCEILPMDDKIIRQDVEEALSLCCGENAFDMDAVNEDNWLRYRKDFLMNVAFNGGRSHDSIMVVLYWFRQFNENEID